MNNKEPEVMRMLRKIREDRYEEIKNLTSEERVIKIREEAEACKKRYGLKLSLREKVKK
ncbi:MAG: hypothetical protein ABIH66_11990 [bacterium]